MCLELCFIKSWWVYLPVDDLEKISCLTFQNRVFMMWQQSATFQCIQHVTACIIYFIKHTLVLSVLGIFFYLIRTPIFSSDFTSFFDCYTFPFFLTCVYFALLFMIHRSLVSSCFSHLRWRLNAWYSKPLGFLQNMTYYLYNFWFSFGWKIIL